MPLRVKNLTDLAFDTHLFVRAGVGQISTLELSRGEVKNKTELAYDIPTRVAKTLLEYRDRIAPKIIGHRPARLFVKVDGTAKGVRSVARLIVFYARRNHPEPASVPAFKRKSLARCSTGSIRDRPAAPRA
jgi:hypothetical protein